jgi:hypothetical protein
MIPFVPLIRAPFLSHANGSLLCTDHQRVQVRTPLPALPQGPPHSACTSSDIKPAVRRKSSFWGGVEPKRNPDPQMHLAMKKREGVLVRGIRAEPHSVSHERWTRRHFPHVRDLGISSPTQNLFRVCKSLT